MAYILKIKYENNLRRVTVQENELERGAFTFAHLESRIRDLFQLPAAAALGVTYTDEENDVVTMGNDQDLTDALVEQLLNPLRIHVTLAKAKSIEKADTGKAVESDAELAFKRLLRTLSSTPEAVGESVKHAFQPYEPLFEGVKSPAQLPSLVENVMQTIAAQITSAVKNGAAAASATAAAAAAPSTSEFASGAAPDLPAVRKDREVPQFCPFVGGPPSMFHGADGEHDSLLTVHHGVICDVCGASPIVGNRWKSKEKHDYDLCHSCFEKHGNENEYTKIEQPKFRRRHMGPFRTGHPMGGASLPPHAFHGPFHGPNQHLRGRQFGWRGPFGSAGRHPCGPIYMNGVDKLYARFVCDVTVFDGTEVAPGTQFVKIWRLRNSGIAPWPVNTSLVFVGGDELGHVSTVPLEIPEQGLAPDVEMEASVDMVAPEKPGRYVSHWRLASPAGPKFGQRLSVIIQVVPKTTLDGVAAELDPHGFAGTSKVASDQEPEVFAGSSSQTPAELVDGGVEKVTSNLQFSPLGIVEDTSSVRDVDEAALVKRAEDDFSKLLEERKELLIKKEISSPQSVYVGGGLQSLVGDLAVDAANVPAEVTEVGGGEKEVFAKVTQVGVGEKKVAPENSEAASASEGRITYPVLPVMPKEGPIAYPVVDSGETVEPVEGEDLLTGKALLAKLEAMGFTDSKLNAELLEKNSFDLRKTLDDLCAAEEWDPILDELEEMGFYDTAMNRRLMFKNNGSVKRVVKELVQMYRDIQGKREKVE